MTKKDKDKLILIVLISYIDCNKINKNSQFLICTPSEKIMAAEMIYSKGRTMIYVFSTDLRAYKMELTTNNQYLFYPDNEVLITEPKGFISQLWIRSFGMMQSMVHNEEVILYTDDGESYKYLIKMR